MTKTIVEIFDYISNPYFNAEVFRNDLMQYTKSNDFDLNKRIEERGKTSLLLRACKQTNLGAVKVLLEDFGVDPNAIGRDAKKNVTAIYSVFSKENDEPGTPIFTRKLQILDLLIKFGARTSPDATKGTADGLLAFASESTYKDLLLHGASPESKLNDKSAYGVSQKTKNYLETLRASSYFNSSDYIYVTKLHSKSEEIIFPQGLSIVSKSKQTLEEESLADLKRGKDPKIGAECTDIVKSLLAKIASELHEHP